MNFLEQAAEAGVDVQAEYSRHTSCSSTPPSSFQLIQSRLIRPFPLATTVNFLEASQSSSQHADIYRAKGASLTDFIVNLAEEGEGLELEDGSCNDTSQLLAFEHHHIGSHSLHAMPPTFHAAHKNDACDQFYAAENLVVELGEEKGSSSVPFDSSFRLATQPAPVSIHNQSSGQCSLRGRTVNHFETTLNVIAPNLQKKGLELKIVADEIDSSMPLSSSQLFQSRLFSSSPSTSVPTIDILHQTNQSAVSHHLAPFSVSQDCFKQMQSVRSSGRGDVCRRRLFSKSIAFDEVATPVPIAAKKARIEDYVDTFLLAEVAQKIQSLCQQKWFRSKSLQLESNLFEGRSSFEWPTADLQAMTTSTPMDSYSFTTQQQLLTTDDLEIKHYPSVCDRSRRSLNQQDIKSQNLMCHAKNTSSQFSSCGWAIRGYDHDRDQSCHIHHSNASKAEYAANDEGLTLSPISTPPDNFQSFDTTVSIFQT